MQEKHRCRVDFIGSGETKKRDSVQVYKRHYDSICT